MKSLRIPARPLIFSSQRLVLTFSHKAAYSHAILWFYLKERLMAVATKIVPFLYPDDIGEAETGDTAYRLFQSETKTNPS
jgi:hypothetical protein